MLLIISKLFYFLAMVIAEISWLLDCITLITYRLCMYLSDFFDDMENN